MYIKIKDAEAHKIRLHDVGNIDRSGSVLGMRHLYGWPKGGQVRVGRYIYNVGVSEVERARRLGILRGTRY
jgi:hypothetical protein